MVTEQLINDADKKFISLCVENKRLRIWVYILLGILTVLVLTSIYVFYYRKLNLYKCLKLEIFFAKKLKN